MAKFTDVNSIGTGAQAIYRLKTVKKTAGWTVPRSSDGSTYNASGDQITSGAAGAGGWANNSAWAIVQEPGGRRQWSFQRGTTNLNWRVKYSANAKFTGGSPSALVTPSATDEQILIGGGTDAAPAFLGLFPNDNTYRVHIVANSTPIGGVYPFILFCTLSPGSTETTGGIWQEPMAPGSYDAADQDPCVVGASTAISQIVVNSRCWFAYGTANQVWVTGVTGANSAFNGTLPADLVSSKDLNGRPLYTGASGGTRIKGYGATVAVKGPARAYPATANRATDAYVYLGGLVYPYPDNTEPGV